ncbi:hypothetical protein GPROT1_02096 [Gammaproteobacteria bacterium]|jgi:cytoskeletal protein CcmA (bactofilin family)|nr:hypothetical protein GPROT1_02096 [Gammaproteobacteria bacterium]
MKPLAPERPGEPVLLEPGTRFDGLLSFRGSVRVEGRVVGTVLAWGRFVLGAAGQLEGVIEADEVVIEGLCSGEVRARSRIELRPGALVSGQLHAPRLAVLDGASFDGQWQIGGEPRHPEPPLEVDPPRVRGAETAALSA